MPVYKIRAIDSEGKALTLREDAGSEADAARALADRGFTLARVVSVSDKAGKARGRWGLPRKELIDFTERMQLLYAAGVPLAECVREIERGARDPHMSAIAAAIRHDLEEGRSLSGALDRFPRAFPQSYRAAIRAAEASGALDTVLRRLIGQIEWEQEIRSSLIQAFTYPLVLFFAVIGLVAFLFAFLLPRLMKVFIDAGVELPGITKAVVAISDFTVAYGIYVLCGFLAFVGLFFLVRSRERGRVAIDYSLTRIPVLGPLVTKVASARFVSTLKTLHQAGTPMLDALRLSQLATGNACLSADIARITARVEDGVPLTEAMAKSKHLEPLVPRMIAVGEMSGSLTEALDHVANLYHREVRQATKRLLSLLEPAILLGAGLLVGFTIFATLLPIFRLFGAIKG